MKLFEIDERIKSCIDDETGEVFDEETLLALQMEREDKIKAIAQWVLELKADAVAYGAQKDKFAALEKSTKNKIDRLSSFLAYALDGNKFVADDKSVAISFRKSEAIKFEDEDGFVAWATENGKNEFLTLKSPTVNKAAVKDAIKAGEVVYGAEIVQNNNIQIK